MRYIFLIPLMIFMTLTVKAQEKGWVKLGEKTVAFKSETDKVSMLGNDNTVDKIKLKCTQGTLQLQEITIVMKGGEKKTYDAKASGVMTKGMSSLPYAVPDKDGKIETNNGKE